MLLRLASLGVTNAIAMLRLLPMSDRDKDIEILTLRHQITVLERQLHGQKIQFSPADRALLAALLHRLPRDVLRRIRLLMRPDTVLRWHRDLVTGRQAGVGGPDSMWRVTLVVRVVDRGVIFLPRSLHECVDSGVAMRGVQVGDRS